MQIYSESLYDHLPWAGTNDMTSDVASSAGDAVMSAVMCLHAVPGNVFQSIYTRLQMATCIANPRETGFLYQNLACRSSAVQPYKHSMQLDIRRGDSPRRQCCRARCHNLSISAALQAALPCTGCIFSNEELCLCYAHTNFRQSPCQAVQKNSNEKSPPVLAIMMAATGITSSTASKVMSKSE